MLPTLRFLQLTRSKVSAGGREWSGGRMESGAAGVPTDYCRLGAAADEVADAMQIPAGHVGWREETEVGGGYRRAPGRRATWRLAKG